MIFDYENLFSDNQAVTGTAVSENVVAVPENVGSGEEIFVSVHVTEAFAGLTNLSVELQSAAAEAGPYATIAIAPPVAAADLVAGQVFNMGSIPPKTGKFLRLNYVVSGTATAGRVYAGIVWDKQTNGVV